LRCEPYFFKKNKYSFARWRTCYGVTVPPMSVACIRTSWRQLGATLKTSKLRPPILVWPLHSWRSFVHITHIECTSFSRFKVQYIYACSLPLTLEEIVSKSTLLATRPSRLAPKKCINKSIWLATGGGAPSMGKPRGPSGCQPNWFVYAFFGCESRWPSCKEGWFGHDFF